MLSKDCEEVQRLLVKCEELVETYQYDLAEKFCQKILTIDPTNIDAIQLQATILIDSGNVEGAKEVLRKAINVQPDTGAEKFIALAQLSEGTEALQLFQKALLLLQNVNTTTDEEADILKRQTIAVFCSIAELYMTDLCMEEGAEQTCESFLTSALQLDPSDFEVLQTMANLRLSQSKEEEAEELLGKSIELWSSIPYDHPEYPSYEFRLICSRLLVEMCTESTVMMARAILESLVVEDEDVLEAWYLLAVCLVNTGHKVSANNALMRAESLLISCDKEFSENISEYITELRQSLGDASIYENMESEEEDVTRDLDIDDDDIEEEIEGEDCEMTDE